jgi:hypothetical protein
MNEETEQYQAGYKDGFCRALQYVIDNAKFHQSTYESLYNSMSKK